MSHRMPPKRGPTIGATTVVMPHSDMAEAASLGGKTRSSRVWDRGIIGPPDRPWQMRKKISTPREGAKPQAKTYLALMFLFYLLAILLVAKANTAT